MSGRKSVKTATKLLTRSEGTKHFSSYKKIHKHKTAKKILKAVGEKRMKKAAVCATCHYTVVETKGKPKPVAGTSCESCHGPASEWISIHNNKKVDKATRVKQSVEAGMKTRQFVRHSLKLYELSWS